MSKSTSLRAATRAGAVLVALLLAASVALIGGQRAAAAPPYATRASITDLAFTTSSVMTMSTAQMRANWSLPDDPARPAGFTIVFPSAIVGRGDTFPLTAKDDPSRIIATCVASAGQLDCDFDADYLAAHPRELEGDVHFWVKVNDYVTEQTHRDYAFGDVQVPVTVLPYQTCTTNCELDWRNSKAGTYDYATDTIAWVVHIAAPKGGMAGGQVVTVSDTPTAGAHTVTVTDDTPVLRRADKVVTNALGYQELSGWASVPRSQYSVTPEGTVTFTTQQGYYYEIHYVTKVTDQGASTEYSNRADYTIAGASAGHASGAVRYAGGGGSGQGADVGTFAVTKVVDADVPVPANQAFTGTYTVTAPEGDISTGTFRVKAGETWRSGAFVAGSVVRLSEDAPAGPAGVTWAPAAFSSNDFALVGGALTPVTLTNRAVPASGWFEATKTISGGAAAEALVPQDAVFTLAYSYPAGVGFAAGAGELQLKADGVPVRSAALPFGARVTVAEVTPAALEGATWGAPVISPSTFTVGGEVVSVRVENPIVPAPSPSPTPTAQPTPTPTGTPTPAPTVTPPTAQPPSVLPQTGTSQFAGPALLIGAAAVMTAGLFLGLARRRGA